MQQGATLGHYEIRSLLGAGGMGEVYSAYDLSLHRLVALKLLRQDVAADENRLMRFKREALAASGLNHPNILTVYAFGQEGSANFIATELIDGESLSHQFRQVRPELHEVLEIGIQVASALGAAHAAGIVHRDIKPENILVRRDRLVKVVDFGIAKFSEQQNAAAGSESLRMTAPGTVIGTAPYMSPEQVRGHGVDARTDIWSLGVVLYQMVASNLPFDGKTVNEVVAEILKTEPTALSKCGRDVPAELERIVHKALRKYPDERYQSARDLELDLKSLKRRLEFEAEARRTGGRTTVEVEVRPEAPGPELKEHYSTRVLAAPTDTVSRDRSTSVVRQITNQISRPRGRLTLAVLALLALAGAGWWLYSLIAGPGSPSASNSTGSTGGTGFEIVPFTSFPGNENGPSFSPGGDRIAFSWNGGQGGNSDIYVKQIGTDDLQRLTSDPASDIEPRWSPNGLYIAFLRRTTEGYGLYVIPSIGGTERKLTNISLTPPLRFDVAQVSWSPDSSWLAVSDRSSPQEPFSIYVVARDSGERRRLTSPPPGSNGDLSPAVSPDGKTVAYRHFESGGVSEIYVVPVAGGEPRRLTFSDAVKASPAWTPDGRDILYLAEIGGNLGLWRMPATGGTPQRIEAVGQSVTSFAISQQGNRLAWAQTVNDSNIWQVDLLGIIAHKQSARTLIASTRADVSSQFSPDGKRIVFASTRSGRAGIWISDSEGQHQALLCSFDRGASGSPRWSPDGRWIVFDGRVDGNADIYRMSPDGGKPLRLTTESSEDIVPSVSRDGHWIYFCSNRSGARQIWRMPANGGSAVQVTKGGGFDNVESPDGRYLYYAKERGQPGIWRLPVAGGDETLALDQHQAGLWRQWAVVEEGIFFATAENPDHPLIEFYKFATGKTSLVMALDKRLPELFSGLAVSPAGDRLIWTQLDDVNSDINLMERFQ
jgi:Tol biopolymer transport system component/serine/threonine protein kinase